ncbi:MAG TPA: iron-sulfur cluster assembly scaffold protein [Rhizobiales bacterium]|nr:iron-sulfur cluster assembly scaffold protein [Hyphomicrobiales bacterium]
MLNDIYNRKILELAGNIPLLERLDDPHGTAMRHARLCGSRVEVDVRLKDGAVVAYGQDVKACALGQAAASIMARHVIGSSRAELEALRDQVRAMLKENGPPPGGKWRDIAALEPVREIKARHASTMLVFEAVCEAIANSESQTKEADNE